MTDNSQELDDTTINDAIDQALDAAGIVKEEEPQEQEIATEEQEEFAETVEIPESQQKAMDSGWVPKDQYQGDPDQWIDFDEFNRRTPLFDKIGTQGKHIKTLEKRLDALVKHNQTLEQKTREKVLAELKKEQRNAVEIGDTEAYDAAEEKIKAVQEEEAFSIDEPEQPKTDEIPKPIKDFAERNKDWFEKDKELTDFAVFKVQRMVSEGLTIDEALEKVPAQVKQAFPEKFQPARNPKKDKPSAVMNGNRDLRPKGKTLGDLTPEQRTVWQSLRGVMSEEEFLSQLEALA